jgi:hypothetical protein
MGRTVLLSATMALALLLACGGVAHAIINGEPERNANDHPYVGLAYTGQQACTGTLISPRVFLTLGYCTQNWQDIRRPKVHVTFLQSARFDAQQFQPEYSYAGVPHTHPQHGRPLDVGVVVLDEPVRTGDGYAKLPEAGIVEDLPHRADLDVVGYDIKNLTYCYGGSCGPYLDRPRGHAIRYNATQEYLGKRDFDNPEYRSDLSYIKTSQASAEKGREGTCFNSHGIPYFLGSDNRTIVAIDSYFGAMDCTGTTTAERIDRPAVLDWVRTFL